MSDAKKPMNMAEFSAQADAIARRLVHALEGEQQAFLVLEALCRVHRFTCMQLPPDSLGGAGFAHGGGCKRGGDSGNGRSISRRSRQ